MKALLRKTLKLFAAHPVLWLPWVCYAFLDTCLKRLRSLAARHLYLWFATRHSVLGGEFQAFDDIAQRKALLVASPLGLLTNYLGLLIEAAAMVVTAAWLASVLAGQKPSLGLAIRSLRGSLKRVTVYALKYCVLTTLLFAAIGWPLNLLLSSTESRSQILSRVVIDSGILVSLLLAAWVIAPIAVALLRPADAAPVSDVQKRQARFAAVAAYLVHFLLSLSLGPLMGMAVSAHRGLAWLFWLESPLMGFSTLLLFIALALIARDEPVEDAPLLGPRGWSFLRALMPLHYPPSGADSASQPEE